MDNDKVIDIALKGAKALPNPTRIDKKNVKVVKRIVEPPSVSDSLVEMLSITNPLEFLAKVVNGEPLPEYVVNEEGGVDTYYVTPTLTQRISVARFLADKYIPKMTVNKHYHEGNNNPEPGERNYEQIVSEAADKQGS